MSKIIVIGQEDIDGVDSFSWESEYPNLEEFDSIILDLSSFPKSPINPWKESTLNIRVRKSQEMIDLERKKYLEQMAQKMSEIKEACLTFMMTSRFVYCILDDPRSPSGDIDFNYCWFPFNERLTIRKRKQGKTIKKIHSDYKEYFNYVKKWNIEIKFENPHRGITHKLIATNKSDSLIGLVILHLFGKGGICLLPKTDPSTRTGIEILINNIINDNKNDFPFMSEITIPKLNLIDEEILAKKNKIEIIDKIIEELSIERKGLIPYRYIFSYDSKRSERGIKIILAEFGIKTTKSKVGFPVDLVSPVVAIEVTSIKGMVKTSTRKVNQLWKFDNDHRVNEKMVLVANTYKDIRIEERPVQNIDPALLRLFESKEICFVTSKTLYQYWLDVENGIIEKQNVANKILETIGELNYE